ncbi:Cold-shock DEAD-box protein A [Bacillus paralicheniformis]|nr:Cold-shock DEAD-box protein A [Bacillus paralicheniformis]TWJ52570.1 hypothetical protein CHCC5023_3863 [Bacillus paralicheniformis]TWJ63041.1 hypothetical protein CHCC5021_1501 [Bacillus paralicheniformis]TWJ79284.1 hypothetical protein CHCC5019_0247 [Bacillus paralicheniformis]TWK86504.1 hypothetical protein CHCC20333_1611 [Bacillus paralicheniformis]
MTDAKKNHIIHNQKADPFLRIRLFLKTKAFIRNIFSLRP